MSLYVRPSIMGITPYVQGAAKAEGYTGRIIKLSSNEAALGPSPKAIAAYHQAADELSRYCEGSGVLLREAIGRVYNLAPERLICGAGSDELISFLLQAYAGPGDEVLYSEHGFLMYAISAKKVGATPIAVPEKNLTADVDAFLRHVTDRTRIIFLANPNNPTGSYIPQSEVVRLRQGLPPHVLLVLDSAYAEFVDRPDFTDGREIVDMPGENTVMTRTFSKIYGLAGLRIGWAYCPSTVVDVLHRVRGPFNISWPAIVAGIAAIEDTSFTEAARKYNNDALKWMTGALQQLGLMPYPSVANFILVAFPEKQGQNAKSAYHFLQTKGIIVRPVENYGLPHCLRITLGLEEENKLVIEALTQFHHQNT